MVACPVVPQAVALLEMSLLMEEMMVIEVVAEALMGEFLNLIVVLVDHDQEVEVILPMIPLMGKQQLPHPIGFPWRSRDISFQSWSLDVMSCPCLLY